MSGRRSRLTCRTLADEWLEVSIPIGFVIGNLAGCDRVVVWLIQCVFYFRRRQVRGMQRSVFCEEGGTLKLIRPMDIGRVGRLI